MFAEHSTKKLFAVFREWSSPTTTNDNDDTTGDGSSRDRIKKIKTLLTTCLPAEQVATLT